MRRVSSLFTVIAIASLFLLFGCQQEKVELDIPAQDMGPEVIKAVAVLHPTEGNEAQGLVTFTKVGEGLQIVVDGHGLTPGKHGFHIHQYGDCSANDATSAGGHFNPLNKAHGGPESEEHHVGDLGNIEANENGRASLLKIYIDPNLTLNGPNSIIGRAVIVHSGADDFTSQPTGNAGSRVACGVIGIAESPVEAPSN